MLWWIMHVILGPDLDRLLAEGYKKQKLRAHSDFAWNWETNAWALSHWRWADIMVEAKGKNLASQQLYDQSLDMDQSLPAIVD
jgi:UV DNA damage endonuclease